MKVAIVAGETSGDYLGSELIEAMRAHFPDTEFVGLCGPLMQEQGAVTLAEMGKISIFGLDGLLGSIREILSIRKKLYEHFIEWQPDIFIGIDVPDFNLALEAKLKQKNIPVIHYVSPTVWAWRGGRIKKIRRSIDLMLTLFPFEKTYYQQHDTPVEYVGHPLAKQVLDWQVPQEFAEKFIDHLADKKLIALMPGSRASEVTKLAPVMLDAAVQLKQKFPNLIFVIPAANQKLLDKIVAMPEYQDAEVDIILGHSRDLLAVCNMAILASGTAALEAALFAKPMIVLYKVSKLSAWVYKNSITVEHYSMPNHLTNPPIVPELIQDNATVNNLVLEAQKLLIDEERFTSMQTALAQIAPDLNKNSGQLICSAITELLNKKKASKVQ